VEGVSRSESGDVGASHAARVLVVAKELRLWIHYDMGRQWLISRRRARG
jgi:hypothetical protein